MNEFYSIAKENQESENEYQLINLGAQTIMGILGKRRSAFWGESDGSDSQTYYTKTTSEDYDRVFANKIIGTKPPYDLHKLLDFHLDFYVVNEGGDKDKFIRHIKYIILPIIKQRKKSDVYIELVTEWVNQFDMNKKEQNKANVTLKFGDVNAPTQFQVNSDNSSQTQQITYNEKEVKELFDILQKDIKKLEGEIKEDFQIELDNALKHLKKGKDISSRLLTIGSLIKDVGIGVFTNLVASPIFEGLRPLLGL